MGTRRLWRRGGVSEDPSMAELPVRACRDCGQPFPLTAAHWYRDRQRFRPICKACTRALLAKLKATAKARHAAERAARLAARGTLPPKPKPHWIPNPTGKGLDPALTYRPGGLPHPKAPPKRPPTFRDVLLAEAQPRLDELAERLFEGALAGDTTMLKYVADLLLDWDPGDGDELAQALRRLAEDYPVVCQSLY